MLCRDPTLLDHSVPEMRLSAFRYSLKSGPKAKDPLTMVRPIPVGVQFVFIVPTFLLITFSVTSVWELVADKASGLLKSQRAFGSVLRVAGGLTILTGIGLALARR
jgi:hypothetical protein